MLSKGVKGKDITDPLTFLLVRQTNVSTGSQERYVRKFEPKPGRDDWIEVGTGFVTSHASMDTLPNSVSLYLSGLAGLKTQHLSKF